MTKRIPSGTKGADQILKGGLPEGKSFLISGTCGTGKTIFSAQFIYEGLKRGESCVYITLEEEKSELKQDLATVGIDFEKYEKNRKLRIIGGPFGTITVLKRRMKAKARDLVNEIVSVAKEVNAKRLVIDPLNLFLMLFDTDVERRTAFGELSRKIKELGCTAFYVCEVNEGIKGISWYGFEEYMVDGVILFYRVPYKNTYENGITIVKIRGASHEKGVYHVEITDKGLVVQPEQKLLYELK